MNLRWIGAILIIAACGGVGFSMAYSYCREIKLLRSLMKILKFMQCELSYRLTPLPQLLFDAAEQGSGAVAKVFRLFSEKLEVQECPDCAYCMNSVLKSAQGLPKSVIRVLTELGGSLGRFDIDGQLSELSSVERLCEELLSDLVENKQTKIRNYQTLGLCAGAALAILLI